MLMLCIHSIATADLALMIVMHFESACYILQIQNPPQGLFTLRIYTLAPLRHLFSFPPRNCSFFGGGLLVFCSHYVDMAKSFLITDKPFKKAHFSPHTQIFSQIPSHLFLGFFVPNLIQEFTVSVVIYVLPNTSQYSPLSLLHNEHNSTGYFRFLFPTQNEANRQGVSSKIAEVAVPSVLDDVLSPSQHHVVVCEVGLY